MSPVSDTGLPDMRIDENEFFRQATLRICGSLDIEEAMERCLQYLEDVMPVDQISLHSYEGGLGAARTIVLAGHGGGKKMDILTPLSPKMREKIDSQDFSDALIINRPDLGSVSVQIINRPELDPLADLVLYFSGSLDTSNMLMRLEQGGAYLGVVAVAAKGRDRYTKEHARLISLLYEPFSIALSNALRHQDLLRLKDVLSDDNRYLHRQLLHLSGEEIVGVDSGLGDVMELVERVAFLDSPVLLLGETGVGKDVIANAIHYSSGRKDGPFIKVNCGAIPETLIDSELFGHEKGAFTGAVGQSRGCFERANRGTIFLDEIGELPLAAQVRLLRVIQYREIQRVGGSAPVSVDLRVVAATHRDLEGMVKEERFREDLWFRLNVFPISVPPLRARKADIPALLRHFIVRKSRDLKIPASPIIEAGAIDLLMNYHWPGNVRELENVVERALILSGGAPLSFSRLLRLTDQGRDTPSGGETDEPLSLNRAMARHIRRILDLAKGRIHGPGGAADLLEINPSTLRSKMEKLGIPYGRRRK